MAYSFQNFQGTVVGPGGVVSIGFGAGIEEGGVTFAMDEDKNTKITGADGRVMHVLNAGNGGVITVRVLKTSELNGLLMAMYNLQRVNSVAWGKNTISGRDVAQGDSITAQECAFKKVPDLTFNKAGASNEWTFDVGRIDAILGTKG